MEIRPSYTISYPAIGLMVFFTSLFSGVFVLLPQLELNPPLVCYLGAAVGLFCRMPPPNGKRVTGFLCKRQNITHECCTLT